MSVFVWDDRSCLDFTRALKISGIPVQKVFSQEELLEHLSPDSLVVMNQTLEARREVVRHLVTERIPFALYGLPGPDEASRAMLARRLKKRHVSACWLGSLRFLPGVFRLKELINSGVFGRLQSVEIGGTDEISEPFDFFRRGDLLQWLLSGTEMEPAVVWKEAAPAGEYSFLLHGMEGTAHWQCSCSAGGELFWQMGEKAKKMQLHYVNSLVPELQLLYAIFLHHRPWLGIARIVP